MKNLLFLITAFCTLLLPSCDMIEDIIDVAQPANGTVYLWISTDADTYVDNYLDFDHSGYDFITVGHTGNSIQRSYVNFPETSLPPGTIIEEAYFELYHSGKNEDGKTDDISLAVHKVRTPWNAGQMKYANQPIPTGSGGGEFHIKLESQNWSGTQNLSISPDEIGPAGTFEGFLIFIPNYEPGYTKGFYSGNHSSRTLSDLGLAPRLMLKVKLPAGTSTDDINLGPSHIDGSGGNYVGFRFRTGTDWPADWNLAHRI